MNKKKFYKCRVVFIFCTLAFSTSFGQQQCKDLFLSSQEPLDILTTLESEIDLVVQSSLSVAVVDPEVHRLIYRVRGLFDNAVDALDFYSTDRLSFSRAMNSLSYALDRIKRYIFILETRQQNTDLALARENPLILMENRLYEIQSMDPSVVRVSFSKDVLEGIFWNEQPIMQRAAGLIFRGLDRGRRHATDKSGIIAFTNDSSVYKVKITGDVVGAIRVAGFFYNHDFHIVAWSNESSHNEHNSLRLTERVNNARERFIRLGYY